MERKYSILFVVNFILGLVNGIRGREFPDAIEDSFANHGAGSDEAYFYTLFGFFMLIVFLVACAPK
jgi:hypothetical protein